MPVDPTARIHASAVVEDGATIGADVHVGPFCHVGAAVTLADGVDLKSHVVVAGHTSIGPRTRIWPFASIGHQPQDLKFAGEDSHLDIGADNMIRESVTMNPGTSGGGGVTRVGNGNLLMVNVHVGHDCQVGNGVVIANNVSLAGHVIVEDNVVIGGHAGIHQFCRIGKGAMVGVLSAVLSDVIPYGTVTGDAAHLAGMNYVGLKRRDTDKAVLQGLRQAVPEIFEGSGTLRERAERASKAHGDNPLVAEIVAFILADSKRAFCLPDA